jgi:DNA-binding transcriptional LysR family regulator
MHIDWNGLQTIEALVRTGSIQAAASELGLRHSSVSRRVDALERELGVSLFVRGARVTPTALARDLAERATQMRPIAGGVEELIAQTHRARAGQWVVTTSDVLAPLLFRALERTPVPHVEVHVSDAVEALAPGSVDVALRPDHEPQAGLKGRQLGRLRLGVFRASSGADAWVQPSTSLRSKKSMRWWKEVPVNAPSRVTCDSLLAMRDACAAGLGRAVLPVFIGHATPRLRLERELSSSTPVWLLTAPVRSDEARAQRDALAAALRELDDVWVTPPSASR